MRLSSCPVCGKPAVMAFRPFCGHRCADVDLGRWFTDLYRIPAAKDSTDEEDAPRSLDRDLGMG